MLGLTDLQSKYDFNIDRTWTTRQRRPGEGDDENVFETPEVFERKRPEFLFTFQTYPSYEYGIERPRVLELNEVRMRILMPVFAKRFRELVDAPTIFCAIIPYQQDPEQVFLSREPDVDHDDMNSRLSRYFKDSEEAKSAADICFQNIPGLNSAIHKLATTVIDFLNH